MMISFNNILSDFIDSGKSQIAVIGKGKSIDKIDNALLIQNIFQVKNKKVNFLNTQDYILAFKLLDVRVKKYDFNKDVLNNLNTTLSLSFYKDFSNYYLQNLAIKHKLKRNLTIIDNFLNNKDIIN